MRPPDVTGTTMHTSDSKETIMSTQARTAITQIRSVALHVTDQQAALDFYVGTLGFAVAIDTGPSPDGRWIEIVPPGAATTIALIEASAGDHAGVDTGIRFTTGDVAADHEAMHAAGIDVDPEISNWPGVPPMFTFRDPEANTLYVIES